MTTRCRASNRRWNGWRRPPSTAGYSPRGAPWPRRCAAIDNRPAGEPPSGGARGRREVLPPEGGSHNLTVRPYLLSWKHSVFQLLGNACLDDGLGGNLDGFPRRGVAAHSRLALLNHQLHHSREHELAGALQFLLRQRVQLVEELSRLRALDLEAIGEVREEFRFAHPAGLCHRLFPLLVRAL